MDFFDVVTTQRAMRRLKKDAIAEDVLQKIMDAAICAPSGGNRQNWSFVVVRDPAKRARLGELYREAWGELMKVPYYAGASKEPADSPAGKMLASARHLGEHLGEAPVIVIACVALDPGVKANLTTGASIYPAVQNMVLACRALGLGTTLTNRHMFYQKEVDQALGLPDGVHSYAILPIGYPMGKFGPVKRAPLESVVYQDRWGVPYSG